MRGKRLADCSDEDTNSARAPTKRAAADAADAPPRVQSLPVEPQPHLARDEAPAAAPATRQAVRATRTAAAGASESGGYFVTGTENAYCDWCGGGDTNGGFGPLLLCDGPGCGGAAHTACLVPPLASLPHGRWDCPACRPSAVGRALSRSQLASVSTMARDDAAWGLGVGRLALEVACEHWGIGGWTGPSGARPPRAARHASLNGGIAAVSRRKGRRRVVAIPPTLFADKGAAVASAAAADAFCLGPETPPLPGEGGPLGPLATFLGLDLAGVFDGDG